MKLDSESAVPFAPETLNPIRDVIGGHMYANPYASPTSALSSQIVYIRWVNSLPDVRFFRSAGLGTHALAPF